jgi:hypothetical protein
MQMQTSFQSWCAMHRIQLPVGSFSVETISSIFIAIESFPPLDRL